MHFSKTYTQLLLSLPPELRDNAIQYRQLKKVINQIVNELESLGLKPEVLHDLIESTDVSALSDNTPGLSSPPSSHTRGAGPSKSTTDASEADTWRSDSLSTSTHPPTIGTYSQNLSGFPKVIYELNGTENKIEPQLRIWVTVPAPGAAQVPKVKVTQDEQNVESPGTISPSDVGVGAEEQEEEDGIEVSSGYATLLWSLQHRKNVVRTPTPTSTPEEGEVEEELLSPGVLYASNKRSTSPTPSSTTTFSSLSSSSSYSQAPFPPDTQTTTQEVVIPLVRDTEFYSILSSALESVSSHLTTVHGDFTQSLKGLSRTIADTSRPASVAAGFHPHSSVSTHAGAIRVKTGDLKHSDLYSWREIFQLYVEAEVFESVGESTRGQHTVEESEKRLQLFAERVTQRGLGDTRKFMMRQSVAALETFLNLNLFILNIKKFSHANSEATRKILKKHAKRTALPLPGLPSSATSAFSSISHGDPMHSSQPLLALVAHSSSASLPRLLVQAIGETLLPVIPSVDDYSCLICTSIAFKPIRLSCGHLFCVRCLVKMQKRGKGNCPMCRAPSVLVANRTNVDWALMNFMQDWFPMEAKEKLKSNEKEAAMEEMEEMGIDPNQSCKVM
ncbi:unnamed protein product [Cyclocybe aegerita]|uniref:RING-14 protein n=1 Tax=Cyclocybe aegerita TaxID=1973307 RepID=A0A8S0Y0F5_CYCAE|nr:unnamed protein product [Cyclocybe aegerita]